MPKEKVHSVPPEAPTSGRKLFYGLFIFPLIIAVGMAVLLCAVVLLTRESETPESLITAIKTGSPSKRWQKAFELSNELNQGRGTGPGMLREGGVMKEVIHILKDRKEYDAQTRSYMAMALAKFEAPEASQALLDTLKDEESGDVQVHLIWALGIKKDPQTFSAVEPFLKSPEENVRKTAVYVAGNLGGQGAVEKLVPLLQDPARDVRWNSAVALARLGSAAGYDELIKMLDRETLGSYHRIAQDKIEAVMTGALQAMALLKKPESAALLKEISVKDPSLKVRQAALQALEFQK